jgi:hypothetical protein
MKRQDYDHSKLEGVDADIETSLKEYGFAWIEAEKEYLFYYGIKTEDIGFEIEFTRFDFCSIEKDIDLKKEHDWVEWKRICEYTGLSEEEFFEKPLPLALHDLYQYYGSENIFGESYFEGLTYSEIAKDVN